METTMIVKLYLGLTVQDDLNMKRQTSVTLSICTALLLLFFTTSGTLALAVSPDKPFHINSEGKKMKLEKLVQTLEDANPWELEKVEKILGIKLEADHDSYHADVFLSYIGGMLFYDEGLIIEKVELRINNDPLSMIRLILDLHKDSACFTFDRIKKAYPDIRANLNERFYRDDPFPYITKRPWGEIAFSFSVRMSHPKCLENIIYIPTKWK